MWRDLFRKASPGRSQDKQQLNKVHDAIDINGKILFSIHAAGVSNFEKGRAVVDGSTGRTYIGRLGQTVNVRDDTLYAPDQRTEKAQTTAASVLSLPGLTEEESCPYGSASYNLSGKLEFHHSKSEGEQGCGVFGSPQYSEGLLSVVSSTPLNQKPHQCFIDRDKVVKLELPDEVVTAGPFIDGLASVVVRTKDDPPESLVGFIDKSGAYVIKPVWPYPETIRELFDDSGVLRLQLDGRDTFIDRTGHITGSFLCGVVGGFHDGRSPVAMIVKPDGQILAPDDTTYGYQNPGRYRAALSRVLQSCLGDVKLPHPVEFIVAPDNIVDQDPLRPPQIVEPALQQDWAQQMRQSLPDASGNWPHQSFKMSSDRDIVIAIDGFYFNDKAVCHVIRNRVNLADLPKRALTLKGVRAKFLLSTSGKVTLEETNPRSLYE